MDARTSVYTSKCYWPGVSEEDVVQAARRMARDRTGEVQCVGAVLFPLDGLVLCFCTGPSAGAIRQASEAAGMPCERVMPSIWLSAKQPKGTRKRRRTS